MKRNRLRNSLKFSFLDGMFASAMIGFTENFWVACAEAIKVTALKAGLVSTLTHLLASCAQMLTEPVTKKLGGRLTALNKLVAIQWLSLFPLIFLPVVTPEFRYTLLLVCAVAFAIGGSLPGPAWLSLMSDHLPSKTRGKYFGWRNRILGAIILGCGLFAGQILNLFKHKPLVGFSLIFALAFVCRIVSWLFLRQMFDPPVQIQDETDSRGTEHEIPGSFFKFLGSGGENNFLRFALFVACFNFSVNLTAPYLAVYMIRELHFSYTTFSYVVFSATLTTIFGVKIWGELADQFGHLRVVQATVIYIAIIPILWFVSGDPVWLVLVNSSAGFAWAGFQLCLTTFVFSEVPSAIRTRAIGHLSALNGLAIFAGSLIGGTLLKYLPAIRNSTFLGLLLISAAARIATAAYFLKRLKETRSVMPITTLNLYIEAGALGLQPIFDSGKAILNIVLGKKNP